MTLLEMRQSLRKRVGNPTTGEVVDTLLTDLLNRAYRDIGTKYSFNETRCITEFSTIIGTPRYDVPTLGNTILRVWDITNQKKLYKRGVRYLTDLPKDLPNGQPRNYVRVRNWMQLVPTPDAVTTIAIYHILNLGDLVADDQSPVLPVPWHEGIILKARYMYYDDRGEVGKAIYANNAWKDWLADKPTEMDKEKDDMDDVGVVIPTLGREYGTRFWRGDRRFDQNFDRD